MQEVRNTTAGEFYADVILSLARSGGIPLAAGGYARYALSPQLSMVYRRRSMDSAVILENMILGIYDRFLPAWGNHDQCIDIGGHIGTTAIHLAKKFPQLSVLSVEPYPESFALFRQNCKENALPTSRITVVNQAVAAENSLKTLHIDDRNTGGNSLVGSAGSTGVQVRTKTLASLFSDYTVRHPRFMKIDCEGSEYEIIRSAPLSLLKTVERIVIEYTPGGPVSLVTEKLQAAGFTVELTHGMPYPLIRNVVSIPLLFAYQR